MALVLKEEEIRELKGEKAERLKRIEEATRHPSDVINKVHFFDDDVKAEGQLLAQKIITILVKFGHKMEMTLGEMRKLFSRSLIEGLSRLPVQAATSPSPKETSQKQWEELKARIQQRRVQEVIAEVAKIEVPPLGVPPVEFPTAIPAVVPATTPTAKVMKMEKDLETKTTSSKPSSQRRSGRRKKKEPLP